MLNCNHTKPLKERNIFMKERLKIGVVGLGGRGLGILKDIMLPMEDVDVLGVCDLYEDRTKYGVDAVEKARGVRPIGTQNYKDILNLDIDAVLILCAWEPHIEIAVAAMKKGISVGMEVGGAYSIDDCWKLVNTYEETGTPCMLLENCCYGKREMMALKMAKDGFFGDIVYCEGGYQHDLRGEIAYGEENRHYRLRNYINRNCENYPTHELGPIAKLLNINNGNRMMTLSSMSSSSKGLHQYILDKKGADDKLANLHFRQGDIVRTNIMCSNDTKLVPLDNCKKKGGDCPAIITEHLTTLATMDLFGLLEYMEDLFVSIDELLDKLNQLDDIVTCEDVESITGVLDEVVCQRYLKSETTFVVGLLGYGLLLKVLYIFGIFAIKGFRKTNYKDDNSTKYYPDAESGVEME